MRISATVILTENKNNMCMRMYMAFFDDSAFGAAGNSDIKKGNSKFGRCW